MKLDISLLSKKQIRTIRQWVLVAIVALVCVQSFLGYVIYYSLDSPSAFKMHYSQTGQKLEYIHNKSKEGILSLLDYGQQPTQKKQTAPFLLAVSFNLFIHNGQIKLPPNTETEVQMNVSYHYTANYALAFFQEIPHPPQFG